MDEVIKESGYHAYHDLNKLNYRSKLDLLKSNETIILTYHEKLNHSYKGDNKKKAMRMKGATQSYCLFDS